MAERLPPDEGDDLFEWMDAPERPRPPREPDTGERELAGAGARERPGTGERERLEPSRPAPPSTEERRRIRGDTGEFERSGRRPPPGRRARRRDLPARVRRRQDALIGVLVLAVVIGLIVLVSGGGGGGGEPAIGLKRLVGQTIVAKLGKQGADRELLRRVRQGRVGGLIAFPRDAESLRADIREVQDAAEQGDNPSLLVMVDQEGGDVK